MSGEQPVTEKQTGPGAALLAAREAIGVSRLEVAQALNLPVGVLTALEEDDPVKMPDPVFARGYVRSYAKLLELDPEPLVAQLAEAQTARIPVVSEPTFTLRQKRMAAVIAGGVLVVFVIIALVVWLVSTRGGDSAEEATVNEVPQETVAVQETAREDEYAALELETPLEVAELVEVVDGESDGDTADAQSSEPSAAPVVDRTNARRLTAEGSDRLELTFTADCWVEIRTPENQRLFTSLGAADKPMHLVGAGPFRIRLGYAPGASVRFNGETIPLAPHTQNNVANLVVGQ